jgi:hypothetical protein
MKISLISGISKRQVVTSGPSNLIGSLDWADRSGVNLSFAQKAEIKIKQFNPLISTARGVVRELISGNRGGLADMLYAISPFNTEGKIDQGLKSQYTAALAELKRTANAKYPLTKLTLQQWLALPNKPKDKSLKPILEKQDENYFKNKAFITAGLPDINRKFPFIIYPAATDTGKAKYRQIELMFLNYGGNVDTFNAAVKEGITKSPRNKTFNYLLGKFADNRYFPKDLGLAIRAVVGAALGGDRFSFTDSDVFNPWLKKYGTGSIGRIGIVPPEPITATATVTAAAAWWVPILQSCAVIVVTGLVGALSRTGDEEFPPAQVGGNTPTGGATTGNDLTGLILPVGAAVAAYFLFFSDDNK